MTPGDALVELLVAARAVAACHETDDGPCSGCLEALDAALSTWDTRGRLRDDEAFMRDPALFAAIHRCRYLETTYDETKRAIADTIDTAVLGTPK